MPGDAEVKPPAIGRPARKDKLEALFKKKS